MARTENDELEALDQREKRHASRRALARFVTRATPKQTAREPHPTRAAAPLVTRPGDASKRNRP